MFDQWSYEVSRFSQCLFLMYLGRPHNTHNILIDVYIKLQVFL